MLVKTHFGYLRSSDSASYAMEVQTVFWLFADVCRLFIYACFLQFMFLLPLSQSSRAEVDDYPGILINIGTHQLHIHCTGTGTPTVIIDSGLGGFSLEWWRIQKTLSGYVKVCSYDRAGYGWSNAGPSPRTTKRIAEELRVLLKTAHIPGPYILVGHSFGGFNIRYFASQNPDLVAGMVLIDSSHPRQFERFPAPKPEPRIILKKNIKYTITKPVMPANYPAQVKTKGYQLMATRKARNAYLQESNRFKLSAKQVLAEDYLPDIPLTILSRGKRVWPENELGDELEMIWDELQDDLALLTSQTLHLSAKQSGHLIHLDQPELVTKAILKTVSNVKSHQHIMLTQAKTDYLHTLPSEQLVPLYQTNINATDKYPLIQWNPERDLLYDFIRPASSRFYPVFPRAL
jgi:pimeloyl-ACP methyl ester carboxylesterase